jgi:aromatic-L-amino-acid decarboxylase
VATDFRSNEEGVPGNLRVYCSSEAHSSVEKAVGVCGIGRKNLVKIPVDEHMRLRPELLEASIKSDLEEGKQACAVVAALGTTGTVAVDPLEEIAEICRKYDVWFHVDAAYAGSALLLPEYRYLIKGMDGVDSFVFNPHKWLFTNFDCSAYFVKDVDALIRTFEILPEYLRTSTRGQVNDYRDWGVPLGRRFRALKLWFVLRSYGLSGLQERLRSHMAQNRYFTEELQRDGRFEFLTEPFLNFACFRFRPAGMGDAENLDRLNEKLLKEINRRGRIYLTHTRVHGAYALRVLFGQTYLTREDVDRTLGEIVSQVKAL